MVTTIVDRIVIDRTRWILRWIRYFGFHYVQECHPYCNYRLRAHSENEVGNTPGIDWLLGVVVAIFVAASALESGTNDADAGAGARWRNKPGLVPVQTRLISASITLHSCAFQVLDCRPRRRHSFFCIFTLGPREKSGGVSRPSLGLEQSKREPGWDAVYGGSRAWLDPTVVNLT